MSQAYPSSQCVNTAAMLAGLTNLIASCMTKMFTLSDAYGRGTCWKTSRHTSSGAPARAEVFSLAAHSSIDMSMSWRPGESIRTKPGTVLFLSKVCVQPSSPSLVTKEAPIVFSSVDLPVPSVPIARTVLG